MIAMVKAINVIRQGNENYARGKFQAVILENGREVDWPDNDFEGSSDWQLRSVQGRVTDQSASLYFRIGLQRASGTVLHAQIYIFIGNLKFILQTKYFFHYGGSKLQTCSRLF